MDWDLEKQIIFECRSGSFMYGTNTPESDEDFRGVAIPPLRVREDPFQGFDQADSFAGQDRTIYGLAKFMKLCADSNPNILELLFAPESVWVRHTGEWRMLLDRRELFVSKKAKYTFVGYSFSQMKAIQTHRQWFLHPLDHKPTRQEFGLTDSPIIGKDAMTTIVNVNFDYLTESVRDEVRRERQYRDAKVAWDNYVSWRDNRNPARKALEEKYGFDTKHGLHLLRLMMEGKELLLTGKITLPLPEAEYLLQVRNGLLSYDELMELATSMEADFETWYDQSTLQYGADIKGLKKLYFELIDGWD